MVNNLKCLIVDDERLARKELRLLLAPFKEIEIVGEAENLTEAGRIIETAKPEVVFLDIQLPGANSFDLLEQTDAAFKNDFRYRVRRLCFARLRGQRPRLFKETD